MRSERLPAYTAKLLRHHLAPSVHPPAATSGQPGLHAYRSTFRRCVTCTSDRSTAHCLGHYTRDRRLRRSHRISGTISSFQPSSYKQDIQLPFLDSPCVPVLVVRPHSAAYSVSPYLLGVSRSSMRHGDYFITHQMIAPMTAITNTTTMAIQDPEPPPPPPLDPPPRYSLTILRASSACSRDLKTLMTYLLIHDRYSSSGDVHTGYRQTPQRQAPTRDCLRTQGRLHSCIVHTPNRDPLRSWALPRVVLESRTTSPQPPRMASIPLCNAHNLLP